MDRPMTRPGSRPGTQPMTRPVKAGMAQTARPPAEAGRPAQGPAPTPTPTPTMNIGEIAQAVGMPAKTIRYYEDIGLVRPRRSANGYRVYGARDLHQLGFLGRARSLGFSIEDCRALLALYADQERSSGEVKAVAERHLREIEEKIAALRAMQATLAHLVEACAGDHRPDCPILADLAAEPGGAAPAQAGTCCEA